MKTNDCIQNTEIEYGFDVAHIDVPLILYRILCLSKPKSGFKPRNGFNVDRA